MKEQDQPQSPTKIDKAVDKAVNPPEEPQQTPKVEEEEQKKEASEQAEEIYKKTTHIEAQRLAELKKEFLEIETRIGASIKAFKKFVDNTEIQGRSLAGQAVEKTDDQKVKDSANALLEGTGLKI